MEKAKNINIEKFNNIEQYNDWKNLYPHYYIYNVNFIFNPIRNDTDIYITYRVINNN